MQCICVQAAANLGWRVTVVAPADESKDISFFKGAHDFITPTFETLDVSKIDKQNSHYSYDPQS